jgi:hypothetical protein
MALEATSIQLIIVIEIVPETMLVMSLGGYFKRTAVELLN